jgi:hypothetical protein
MTDTPEHRIAEVTARLTDAGLSPAAADLAAHGLPIGEGITVTITAAQPANVWPRGDSADLLAAGRAHCLTQRRGRYILDGHDITDEYPAVRVRL